MPKSPAFIKIKQHVLAVIACIPAGKMTSFRAVGQHLDVMPRHVAYILAQLSDEEKGRIPWYRVVKDDGSLGRPHYDNNNFHQRERLEAEGIAFDDHGGILGFAEHFFEVTEASTGVGRVERQTST